MRGAKRAGANEIVVMDCHGAGKGWTFNSLIPERLDPACEWVVQNEWTEYTQALEDGCDAALFVAMHAMAGTPDGGLCHTVSGSQWHNLWFNGTLVGETGINAALCGHWECPVVLVTGDTRSVPRGQGAPRRRTDDRRREGELRTVQRAQHPTDEARAADDRGRAPREALSDLKARRHRTTRAPRARSRSSTRRPT